MGDELIPLFTLAIRLEAETEIRIERIKNREKEKFGSQIEIGGIRYFDHLKFIEWASAYENGGSEMRSKRKHDEWQKLLKCKLLFLDGNQNIETNFQIVRNEILML